MTNQRLSGIRRTEFGVRGQYINQLNRLAAARLVQVFCHNLLRHSSATEGQTDRTAEEDAEFRRPVPGPMVVGYDSRPSAPDIFVGVTSAVRELGMPVIDVGRCTAASIQEAVRTFPQSAGAVMVTGAGAEPSFIGFDVYNRRGEALAVVWKEHGIRLQPIQEASIDPVEIPPAATIASAKASTAATPAAASVASSESVREWDVEETEADVCMQLILPTDMIANESGYRISRQFGRHITVEFEDRYRKWLRRWYPQEAKASVVVRSNDPLVVDRVRWLSSEIGFSAACRSTVDLDVSPERSWEMLIEDDDCGFQLTDPKGRMWSASKLSSAINGQLQSRWLHLTAHADKTDGRFWLTDTGRPSSGQSTEQIRDSLVVLGLVLQLRSA